MSKFAMILITLVAVSAAFTTAISSTTGGYQGVSFAIPVNLVQWVSRQLIENGRVRWAYLGVSVLGLTPELARRVGVQETSGVLVTEVRRDSPAAEAGLRPGDVITAVGAQKVSDPRQLQSAIAGSEAGSQYEIGLVREGRRRTVQVTIAEMPAE